MQLLRRAALTAVSLVAIAGCSQKNAGNTAAGSPGAAPAVGPDTVITEADLPRPRAGLWEVSLSTNGGTPEVSRRCETGAPLRTHAVGKDCSTFQIRRTFLGGIVIDAVCASGPVSSSMHMTATGDFNGAYASDSVGTVTMSGHPPVTFRTHTEGRYVGPCPPGGED